MAVLFFASFASQQYKSYIEPAFNQRDINQQNIIEDRKARALISHRLASNEVVQVASATK